MNRFGEGEFPRDFIDEIEEMGEETGSREADTFLALQELDEALNILSCLKGDDVGLVMDKVSTAIGLLDRHYGSDLVPAPPAYNDELDFGEND